MKSFTSQGVSNKTAGHKLTPTSPMECLEPKLFASWRHRSDPSMKSGSCKSSIRRESRYLLENKPTPDSVSWWTSAERWAGPELSENVSGGVRLRRQHVLSKETSTFESGDHVHSFERVNLQACSTCGRFFITRYERSEKGDLVLKNVELDLKFKSSQTSAHKPAEGQSSVSPRESTHRASAREDTCW